MYVDERDFPRVFAEFFRVLKSGGVIRITEDDAICGECGAECAAEFVHSLSADSEHLRMTAGQLGLPRWDILWARRGEETLGIELAGDRAAAGCRD